jgi:hypothetical protein
MRVCEAATWQGIFGEEKLRVIPCSGSVGNCACDLYVVIEECILLFSAIVGKAVALAKVGNVHLLVFLRAAPLALHQGRSAPSGHVHG